MNPSKELTIITTHINSDFDAVASMLAAQKLYPEALLVFPVAQEKNLRNFFIKSIFYFFNMADISDIDFSEVKKLVLVDTRQAGRIGKLASLLERSNMEIHIYDHHPASPNDIKGNLEIHKLTGATITILTEIIKEKKIYISPEEATIMCIGLFEDTGSFTYSSTTEDDFLAAAFLLSKGANLNMVSNLIAREISPEQIGLLNDMIQSATHYNISGIEVVITNLITDNYIPDLALLVQKMMKMENLNSIFVIACMSDKIYIVARSKIADVDVGAILTPLGGGGHAFAASATIKGETLTQVEHRIVDILYEKVRSKRQAKDLMSSPPISIRPDINCKEASTILTRYNINALLVTKKNEEKDVLLGFISRGVIEKALYHKLDEVPIKEYMTTELAQVKPDAELYEIQTKIIENKQRIIPVIDDGIIIGVITRTDLLNILVYQSQNKLTNQISQKQEPLNVRTRNVLKFMKERLSERILELLKNIGDAADEINYKVYVVGGFVRDLFLYRNNDDIDIVVEGEGINFAKKFAQKTGAKISTHETFGTAVITLKDGFKIDVASARLEYYKFPAALPIVELSSIKLDLFRRDFTINTLAIALNKDKFGVLIDFFGAQRDIKEKAIRVLNNLSFVEDPTRIFRAIRFEQRFNFSIGKLTDSLIENAIKMDFFKRLSGRRVFSEIRQILEEENPVSAISRLNEYNLLKVIHPSIRFNKEIFYIFESIKKVISWHDLLFLEQNCMKWVVYFMGLIMQLDKSAAQELCKRFELSIRLSTIFCKERFIAHGSLYWLEQNLPILNSALFHKLSNFKTELILYMMALSKNETVKKAISYYFTQLRKADISITGNDLKEMGINPGPIYKQIFSAVLDSKLNGLLKDRSDELNFVRTYVS